MKSLSVAIQMKAIEQYIPVEIIALYSQVVLTFDEILKCDHSNESYRADFTSLHFTSLHFTLLQ